MFGLKSGKSAKTSLPCLSRFGRSPTADKLFEFEVVADEDDFPFDSCPLPTTFLFLLEGPTFDEAPNTRLGAMVNPINIGELSNKGRRK